MQLASEAANDEPVAGNIVHLERLICVWADGVRRANYLELFSCRRWFNRGRRVELGDVVIAYRHDKVERYRTLCAKAAVECRVLSKPEHRIRGSLAALAGLDDLGVHLGERDAIAELEDFRVSRCIAAANLDVDNWSGLENLPLLDRDLPRGILTDL